MSDPENEPLEPVDPPVNTGGGTTVNDPEDTEDAEIAVDPPVNTGGGGGNA